MTTIALITCSCFVYILHNNPVERYVDFYMENETTLTHQTPEENSNSTGSVERDDENNEGSGIQTERSNVSLPDESLRINVDNTTTVIVVFCPSRKDCDTSDARKSEAFSQCEWSDCEVSVDQERIPEASIVVFKYMDPFPDLPKVRFANQTYIHMMSERPCKKYWWIAKYDDKINLTWNYRYDADIPYYNKVIE